MGSACVFARIHRRCVRSLRHYPSSCPIAAFPLYRELPRQPRTDVLPDCISSFRRSPFHNAAFAKTMAAELHPARAGHGFPSYRFLADDRRFDHRRNRDARDIPPDAEHVGILGSRHSLSGIVREVLGANLHGRCLLGLGHRYHPGRDMASRGRSDHGGSCDSYGPVRTPSPFLLCASALPCVAGCAASSLLGSRAYLRTFCWPTAPEGRTTRYCREMASVSN